MRGARSGGAARMRAAGANVTPRSTSVRARSGGVARRGAGLGSWARGVAGVNRRGREAAPIRSRRVACAPLVRVCSLARWSGWGAHGSERARGPTGSPMLRRAAFAPPGRVCSAGPRLLRRRREQTRRTGANVTWRSTRAPAGVGVRVRARAWSGCDMRERTRPRGAHMRERTRPRGAHVRVAIGSRAWVRICSCESHVHRATVPADYEPASSSGSRLWRCTASIWTTAALPACC